MNSTMELNKEIYNLCSEKLDELINTETPYHWDSEKELQYLKNINEYNQDIEFLWRLCKNNKPESSELENPNIMDIIDKSEALCARVIYAHENKKLGAELKEKLRDIYEKLQKNSKVYKSYKRLNEIDREYGDRYLKDIGLIEENNANYNNYYYPQNYQPQKSSKNQNSKEKNIEELHKRQGDYSYLEGAHDYIQHMFPNHYRSNFNSSAQPLGFLEAQKFRESKVIGLRLLQSVCIFFDFLGLEINRDDFTLNVKQTVRYKNAIDLYTHNHLRLRRILACLSVTGFRSIALRLINSLKHHNSIQWKKYGDNNFKKEALRLCFNPEEEFPDPHTILKEYFHNSLNSLEPVSILPDQNSLCSPSIEDEESSSVSQPSSSNTDMLISNSNEEKVEEELKKENEEADESDMIEESEEKKPEGQEINQIPKQEEPKHLISEEIIPEIPPEIEVLPQKVVDEQSIEIEKKRTDSTEE